ncbi:MAG TPA: TonB-dependent receptor plug domain-containing protein [bacterium]|nr:TonB-dependent receptor plug domain-containing protein [bacterium]
MNARFFATPTALVVFLCFALCFQSARAGEKAEDLGEIEVVSRPIIQGNKTTDYGGQVTTVSGEQIEALGAVDLSGALRTTPGVNITRYDVVGSFGGGSGGAIFIRGIGSSRPGGEIQTMIDGVPVYNGVWNHPLLDLLPVSEAGRIDVYKGAQPTTFGAGFGAVNIVPRTQTEEGYEGRAKIGYGMYNTLEQSLSTSGKIKKFNYSVGQQFVRSSGDRPDSGGRLFNAYLKAGYEMTDHWSADVFGMFTDNYALDPGAKGNPASKEGKYETTGGAATLTLSHSYDPVEGHFKFYWSGGRGDWLNQAGNADDTNSNWLLGGVRIAEKVKPWDKGAFDLGLDVDFIDGDCDFTDDTGAKTKFVGPLFSLISGRAALSQVFGDREKLYFIPSAGFRFFSHSDFPSEFAPHAGIVLGYKDTEAHFAYSRGVNYPGLNVVAFAQNVVTALGQSWKDLKPETLDHIEAGISQRFGKWVKADLTFFNDRGKNRYVMVTTSPPPYFENIAKYTIYGLEGTVAVYPVDEFSFFAGATYLHKSPSDLPYAPDVTLSTGISASPVKNLQIDLDGQYVSTMHSGSWNRTSVAANPATVGAFFLLNGKIRYRIHVKPIRSDITPYLAVRNMTNADYEYQPGYPMPGINVIGGVSWRM